MIILKSNHEVKSIDYKCPLLGKVMARQGFGKLVVSGSLFKKRFYDRSQIETAVNITSFDNSLSKEVIKFCSDWKFNNKIFMRQPFEALAFHLNRQNFSIIYLETADEIKILFTFETKAERNFIDFLQFTP